MKEVRRVEDQENEKLKKLRAEKVCDLAALEDKISKKDSRDAVGTRTFVRPKPRLLKKKVVFSWSVCHFLINLQAEHEGIEHTKIVDRDEGVEDLYEDDGALVGSNNDYEAELEDKAEDRLAEEDVDMPVWKKKKTVEKIVVRNAVKAIKESSSPGSSQLKRKHARLTQIRGTCYRWWSDFPKGDQVTQTCCNSDPQHFFTTTSPLDPLTSRSTASSTTGLLTSPHRAQRPVGQKSARAPLLAKYPPQGTRLLLLQLQPKARPRSSALPANPSRGSSLSLNPYGFLTPVTKNISVVISKQKMQWAAWTYLLLSADQYTGMTQVAVGAEDVDMDALLEVKLRVAAWKFINSDLPVGCDKGNKWRRAFVPTYISFVASHIDPWSVDDDEAVLAMQLSWNMVYLHVPIQYVWIQANQHIYEWCSAFGSAALAIVNAFFESRDDLDTDEARTKFAAYQLRHGSFLYRTAPGDDRLVWSSPIIFSMLIHLRGRRTTAYSTVP
jgi:hypothetical protein